MTRRLYFAFDVERDLSRADQVRGSPPADGFEVAGFFDRGEYEDTRRLRGDAIARAIDARLAGTTVTVVLVGRHTAARPWVRYEILRSIRQGNGLFGVYVHHLKDAVGVRDLGPNHPPAPDVPVAVEFPTHVWDGQRGWFSDAVEAAGKRAEQTRIARLTYASLTSVLRRRAP
jgi:hypothetical protein